MSVGPPAANGMIMVIGRSRNFCALACELNASMVAATATTDFTHMIFRTSHPGLETLDLSQASTAV